MILEEKQKHQMKIVDYKGKLMLRKDVKRGICISLRPQCIQLKMILVCQN